MPFNLRQISSKLSTRGWIAVGVSGLIGVAFILLVMNLASAPSYTTLVSGESASQTQKITAALSTGGITYQLQNNGTAVAVQSSQEGQANDLLSSQGLTSGFGSSGSSFESLLGNQGIGESNFQQQQQNTSAEQQYIAQGLESITGINTASVSLAIPDETDNLFSGVDTQPSAAVLLNIDNTLSSTEVKAIAGQVANSVSGLNVNKVTISDQNGDELWPAAGGTANGLTAKQSEEQAYDSQVSDEANAMLEETLGPNKALVRVDADLNANQQKVASVTYAKGTTPATSTVTKEKLTGNGANTGAAGNTATNIAAYAGSGTGKTNYTNNTSTTANNTSHTISHTNIAPGGVNNETVAILVNSTVAAADLPKIQAAVQNTVGFNKKRGDKISIESVPFQKVTPIAASSSSSKMTSDIKYVAVGLGSVLFLLFVSRLLRKRETDDFAGRPTWLRELEMPRSLSELEAQTQMVDLDSPAVVARLRSPVNLARQQVEELVDRDPERVAAQIRQWMTED